MKRRDKLNIYYNKYERLLKIFSASVLLRGAIVVINLYTGILFGREMGEANRGLLFNLFLGALLLFNVALNFGYNGSAMYFAKKNPSKLHLYLTTNFIITLISVIFIILSLFFFSIYFKFQSDSLRIVFLLCYIAYSFSMIYRSFLIGMDENLFMQKVDFLTRSVYAIFILVSLYFHALTVLSVAIFLVLEYTVFTLIAHRKVKLKLWPLQWDYAFFKENILFNSKAYLAALLYIFLLKADQFIIKIFYGNFQVGVYGLGGTIIDNLFMITAIISTMYLPKILGNDNFTEVLHKSKKILGFILLSSIGIALLIFPASPYIMEIYYKKLNPEGTECLRILLLGFISLSVFIFNYQLYFSVRLKKSLLILLGISLVLNMVLNYLWLPKYGIIGSAWASSVSYTVLATLTMIDLYVIKRRNYERRILVQDEERQ